MPTITIDGNKIDHPSKTTFLGVIIGSTLNLGWSYYSALVFDIVHVYGTLNIVLTLILLYPSNKTKNC